MGSEYVSISAPEKWGHSLTPFRVAPNLNQRPGAKLQSQHQSLRPQLADLAIVLSRQTESDTYGLRIRGPEIGMEKDMSWFLLALKKYATFTGRSRRREYWFFTLFYLIITFALAFFDGLTGTYDQASGLGLFSSVFVLAMFIPSISVAIRRLHDTDRSGWWLLISLIPLIGVIVLLVFVLMNGTSGDNQYGPDPKAVAD